MTRDATASTGPKFLIAVACTIAATACGDPPGASGPDGALDGDGGPGDDAGIVVEPGRRFDSSPTTWPVPTGGVVTGGFWNTAGGNFVVGSEEWATLDLDGDALPDLVVTGKAIAIPNTTNERKVNYGLPGAQEWKWFRNTGSGFETTARSWSLPATGGSPDSGYWSLAGGSFVVGSEEWSTFDLDGDRKPDLVITAKTITHPTNPDTEIKVNVGYPGAPTWKWYRNTGSGFASVSEPWPVPAGGTPTSGFWNTSGGSFAVGSEEWSTFDLDGDRRPDLVVTGKTISHPTNPDTEIKVNVGYPGAQTWNWYRNTVAAFEASAQAWSVPTGGLPLAGFWNTAGGSVAVGAEEWSTFDLDGDRKPDLVVTGKTISHPTNPATEIKVNVGYPGAQTWSWYRNTGAAFEASAQAWSVPTGGLATAGFWNTAGGSFAVGSEQWTTFDLDGDRRPDLVVTGKTISHPAAPDTEIKVNVGYPGAQTWNWYRNTGTAFEASGQAWSVPTGGTPTGGFWNIAGGSFAVGSEEWSTFDLDGNGRSDLVVTGKTITDPGTSDERKVNVGLPGPQSWKVYFNVP